MSEAPFDKREGLLWFDGEMIPWADAQCHVLSHALHYASSVFEGERAYDGEIFKLREHTERLFHSARRMDMTPEYSVEEIDAACNEAVRRNGLSDAYVRPIMWRGSEMMSVPAQKTKIHTAIAAWEWPSYYSHEQRMAGLRLAISKWRRPSPETIPCDTKASGLYMICTLSRHEAEREGYNDAMMLDYRGQVAETTGANVFFIKGNEIHTPTPDCFLDGITRRTVMKLAIARGYRITERAIQPEEMADFDECFLTGTAVEVTPVAEIGPYKFPAREVSPLLLDDYLDLVRRKAAA
ncbi:MAG: branched-chain amino acid aminotransferase [Pseudomonadota bacterium]